MHSSLEHNSNESVNGILALRLSNKPAECKSFKKTSLSRWNYSVFSYQRCVQQRLEGSEARTKARKNKIVDLFPHGHKHLLVCNTPSFFWTPARLCHCSLRQLYSTLIEVISTFCYFFPWISTNWESPGKTV